MSLIRFLMSGCLLTLLTILCPAQEVVPKKQAVKLDASGDPLPAGAVARLGSTRFRHQNPVSYVGYSGDGAILITLSGENSLRFWDAKTGKEIRRIELKSSPRLSRYGVGPSVVLSGDGKTLALGIEDGNCKIIDVATGKTRKEFEIPAAGRDRFGDGGGSRSQLSHDGKFLLIHHGGNFRGGGAGKAALWNTESGLLVHEIIAKNKGDDITAATLSRDGKTLICVDGMDGDKKREFIKGNDKQKDPVTQIRFINVADGKETRTVPTDQEFGGDLLLTADGKHLIVSDQYRGRGIRHIDASTGKFVRNFAGNDKGGTRGIRLASDHQSLFVAGYQKIQQYDLKSGNLMQSFPIGRATVDDIELQMMGRSRAFSPAVTPDGKTLAVPDHGTVAFFDIKTGKAVPVDDGHFSRIDSLAFGPKGEQVLSGSGDGSLYLWNVADNKRVRAFEQKTSAPDEKNFNRRGGGERLDLFRVRGVFSPDGKSVAALWWGERLHLFDTSSGQLRHHLGSSRGASAFSYSPDGQTVALANLDGTLTLFNAAAGRELKTLGKNPKAAPMGPDEMEFRDFEQGAYSTAFSPDGRMLISGGMQLLSNGLKVHVNYFEVASGQERLRFHTQMDIGGGGPANFEAIISAFDAFIAGFAFSPDGKSVVEAGFANVKLRSLRTGAEVRSFGGTQIAAGTTRFSPDGKMLIAGKHDGSLRVWDAATATVLIDFPAHPSHVTALAFSPDGKWLATGARDSGILLWDWDYIRKSALVGHLDTPAAKAEALWKELADKDAGKAYSAIKALAATPAETVVMLKERVRPIPPVDPKVLRKLLDDLDHAQYPVRQKADEALERLGDLAAPAIKERRESKPPVETARRLETLQKKLDARILPQDVLQALRAIEALELIGNAEARAVLDALAKGAPGHRVTEDAKGSLKRLTGK